MDTWIARSQELSPEVGEMVGALADLCRRGGKRLRPALVAVGYRAVADRAPNEPVYVAGLALELLQAYFLIHDDWMDGDEVRRGGPSVHALLTRRLRSQQKGEASAILAGDFAAALSLFVLAGLELPKRQASPLFTAFAEMQLSAVSGQQIDLLAQAKDIETAYVLKTGSYTVEGPLKLGAILANGSSRALRTLESVARPLGVAFQLRDDLIGAFGDPRRTGKPLGNDLTAGKRTVLLVESLARTRGVERQAIERVVGRAKARPAEVRRALAAIESSGARAAVEARVAELSQTAYDAIGPALTRSGAELLRGAIRALTERGA
jgi:geranylgeranyl diphosphate synthase type I